MQTVQAYKRVTRQYCDGWRHLDKEQFVATVKVTPMKKVWESHKGSNSRYVQHCRAPASVDINTLAQALEDTMGGDNCKHEHDCCGCQIRHVRVKHLGNRRLHIQVDVRYNY